MLLNKKINHFLLYQCIFSSGRMSVRKACKIYGVSRTAIRENKHNLSLKEMKIGHPFLCTQHGEESLANYMKYKLNFLSKVICTFSCLHDIHFEEIILFNIVVINTECEGVCYRIYARQKFQIMPEHR